jgi:glutamate N-acetyltransferase/amino-acid N-acetyltransferase
MTIGFPLGFRGAGVHAGIKRNPEKQDVALVVSDRSCVGVGVYTQNLVHAAPVTYDRQLTPSDNIRAVAINSGVANACTGAEGFENAKQMARHAAESCGVSADQVLLLSTGVIGKHLPLQKIASGLAAAAAQLGDDEQAVIRTARGMMTTDTIHKVRQRDVQLGGVPVRMTGLAKGAAMIGPNMATMLGLILTDACIRKEDAREALAEAVDETFNCISVDGHTSTNDTVLLLANGAAGGEPLSGQALDGFKATLLEVCEDLAVSIPADGEGATHLVTVEVHGCQSRRDAVRIAKTVADSPLVKTALAGNDPNWGRIVSAAGYAGVDFQAEKVSLHINGMLVYERGVPVTFDADAVAASMAASRDVSLVLIFDEGTAAARFWTTDLTAEYVRLNADYHT